MKNNLLSCITVLAAVVFTCCTSRPKALPIGAFTALYVDSLSKAYPDDKFVQVDDSTVYEISQGDTSISTMENVYHHYLGIPDSLGLVLHNRILSKQESQQRITRASVFMPSIRTKRYIRDMEAQLSAQGAQATELLYDDYNDDLVVAYVVNTNYAMRYLNKSDLDSLGLGIDTVRSRALTNLRKLLPVVKVHGEKIFMPVIEGYDNGTFEATLLLLPDFIQTSVPIKGDAIIAIPTRDILLVTGSEDKASIALLKQKLPKLYAGDYPISDHLYRWNGKKLERYEP